MNLKHIRKNTWHLLKETFLSFRKDRGAKLSAALAYYTIFSLAPLLIIIISLSGFLLGPKAVSGEIFRQINGVVGNDAALQIQEMIRNVKMAQGTSIATIIGTIILLVGASGVFSEMQDSLNLIWGLKAKPKRGFLWFLKNSMMSFSMIGTMGFLLLVALIINSLMDVLSHRLLTFFSGSTVRIFYVANLAIVFAVITLLFSVVFKSLPNGRIAWKDALIGATFCSFLFMLGKFAIGAYLASFAVRSIYGAAGSIILILTWIYYSAMIFYLGAEFTKVYAISFGQKIIPGKSAVLH